jgi:hypothetical protein
VPRAGAVQLDEDDVARAQAVGCGPDRAGGAGPAEDRDGGLDGVRSDPGDAEGVHVGADLPDHRRAVVAPPQVGRLGAADDAALVGGEVLVGEAPGTLDVGRPDVGASTARPGPGPAGVDPAGGRVQVALPGGEVGADRRRVLGRGHHGVDVLDSRLGRRLDIGRLHSVQLLQLLGQGVEVLVRSLDAVDHRQVGYLDGARRCHRGGLLPQPVLAPAEQRSGDGPVLAQQAVEGADVGGGHGGDALSRRPQIGLRGGDHDQLAFARHRALVVGPACLLAFSHGRAPLGWCSGRTVRGSCGARAGLLRRFVHGLGDGALDRVARQKVAGSLLW